MARLLGFSPIYREIRGNLGFSFQCVSPGISKLYKKPLVIDKRFSSYCPQRGTYLLYLDAKFFPSTKARNIKQVSNQDNLPVHHQMSGYHFQLAESKELQLPEVSHWGYYQFAAKLDANHQHC